MKLSKSLFWLITILWFVAGAWWFASNKNCGACGPSGQAAVKPPNKPSPGFTVSDNTWKLSSSDNFRFGKSGADPVLTNEMTGLLDSTALYFAADSNKQVTITGFYQSGEANNTGFPNLGLARAEGVKKWLSAKGIAADRLLTDSKMSDELVFTPPDTLVGGIALNFSNAPVIEDLFQARTVYFNSGRKTFSSDSSFLNYLARANAYLLQHPGKKLLVTGYTDNIGDSLSNLLLSSRRAAFIRSLLINKGIAASAIESTGKGMNDPVTDNTTEEGKSQNRRVTIQLQ